MSDKDYKKLIQEERSKIKKPLRLGFSVGVRVDEEIRKLSNGEEVIDRQTKLPISKEKKIYLKSMLFGQNPDKFLQLFPGENDFFLYGYMKNYVRYCKENEEYLNEGGYTLNHNYANPANAEQIKKDEKLEGLRLVALSNCEKEDVGSFLFKNREGDPTIELFYFLKEIEEDNYDIIMKTLPSWFNVEEVDWSKNNKELTKPIIINVGSFHKLDNDFKFIQKWMFSDKTLLKLSEILYKLDFIELSSTLNQINIKI